MKIRIQYFYLLILIGIVIVRLFWRERNNPDNFEKEIKVNCQVKSVNNEFGKRKIGCDDYVIYKDKIEINIGDRIEVIGKSGGKVIMGLVVQKSLINPVVKEVVKFDNLSIKNQWFNYPVISIKRLSNRLKINLIERIEKRMESREAALISGMCLGAKDLFSYDFYEELKKAGLVHLVVASGGNILIISSILLVILEKRVARKLSLIGVMVFLLLYLFMVGFEAPLVRASIMFGSLEIAKWKGLKVSGLYILGEAALVMLIIDPLWIFSLSFWLSFCASLGLIVFASDIAKYLGQLFLVEKRSFFKEIIEELSQVLSASLLTTLPLLLTVGEVSLLGIISNILVGFLVAPVSYLGMMYLLIPEKIEIISNLILLLIEPMLLIIMKVTNVFGNLEIGRIKANWGISNAIMWIGGMIWLKIKLKINSAKQNKTEL